MTREAKMLAVVEAARQVVECDGNGFSMGELREALARWDALTKADAEAVTLAVWEDSMGEFTWVRPNSFRDREFRDLEGHGHDCLGTTQITITREGGR